MKFSITVMVFLVVLHAHIGMALEPDEILVVANRDSKESMELASYYCEKRKVPENQVLALSLGAGLEDEIERGDYEKKLADPIRRELATSKYGSRIKCLLTTYGVPFKVGCGPLPGSDKELEKIRELEDQQKSKIKTLKAEGLNSAQQLKAAQTKLVRLQAQIGRLLGKETSASVDSELSLVLLGDYELYRWKSNELKGRVAAPSLMTLMVSRIDGPGYEIAAGLIDKAIAAENTHLKGVAYIDSRGLENDNARLSPGYFDQSLRDFARLVRFRTNLAVRQEKTSKLFGAGSCPEAAIYCGWYSLKKYVDSFDFVDGAIGYHIASLEAVDLRDPKSSQWCPAMLRAGITATLGPVGEPYLHTFPEPRAFFLELFNGRCLVEAYYHTNPFNSWQMVLIGDPLYRPFNTVR